MTVHHRSSGAADPLLAPETIILGGLPIAVLSRAEAAELMLTAASLRRRGRPLFFTSANGEVLARAHGDPALAALFKSADQIVADGQPMVLLSRYLCRQALPERVATTDLFHDVAERAEESGHSFYFLGASPEENRNAVEAVRRRYPRLRIVGHADGYLRGDELIDKLDEIDGLAPDILWLAMGVPKEQEFIRDHGHRLSRVGVIKTSGGLFNFLSGSNPRAPMWMQRAGLEWAFRLINEPRRLAWRYLSTNPRALAVMLTKSN